MDAFRSVVYDAVDAYDDCRGVFEEPRFTDSNMIFSVWVEHGRPPLFDFMRDAICLLDADIFASSFWVECLPTAQESSEEPATSGSSQQPAEPLSPVGPDAAQSSESVGSSPKRMKTKHDITTTLHPDLDSRGGFPQTASSGHSPLGAVALGFFGAATDTPSTRSVDSSSAVLANIASVRFKTL
ncbi:hypothetical protein BDV98DRAFT_359942 [Pterulicium gracile]|uniref:Uncharacterized protein n=1 Tax=Pterulicium gracile TaxID=1884261 RepID=A0A5C3QUQ3_9AGAR|nr:hypothetical protein BDV98DRAFT_359942 [Pterula gracilis]